MQLAKAQLLKYCKAFLNCVLSLLIYCTTHVESSSIVKEIFGSSNLFLFSFFILWIRGLLAGYIFVENEIGYVLDLIN